MIGPVRGVLLSDDDAEYLARALEVFADVLAKQGARPNAKLAQVTETLRSVASASVRVPNVRLDARNQGQEWVSGDTEPYAVMSPSEAAKVLGISPNGVRDLARRGRLGARRSGGRWFVSARAVMERAAR